MKQPIILSVDDDTQVLRALQRDLRAKYRQEYKVMSTTSAADALQTLNELKKQNEEVALFVSDQRMPEMEGVEFLEHAKRIYPEARSVLLTAYSDIDAAVKAINDVGLNYYLSKPWDPPEEKLYPVLDDLLEDWQMNYKPDFHGLRLLGYQFSAQSHELKDFLAGNLFPYQWLDVRANEKAQELMQVHDLKESDFPAVIFEDGTVMTRPDKALLAEKLGLKQRASQDIYDVVIVGAGPAGLAAAVYGGSEGLRTLLIEKHAPGGQAGTSSRIENYLGFPSGLSGADLARRAVAQATRFGVELLSPLEVSGVELKDNYKILHLSDGNEIVTKSLVISTGVEYRKLGQDGMDRLSGAGVYYGAATTEALSCTDKEVYVVGGGNSAGQGAMYLSRFAANVYIVIRRPDLSATMSQYLIDQIAATPNIHIVPESEIAAVSGAEHLEQLTLAHCRSGETRPVPADALFVFIGTKPHTEWMNIDLIRNDKGFLETGRDLLRYDSFRKSWKLEREPYLLETCVPGVFAAGDVRATAMNRVASAVGEGAMTISFVHKYLAEM